MTERSPGDAIAQIRLHPLDRALTSNAERSRRGEVLDRFSHIRLNFHIGTSGEARV
jgi:hypothetical protein